MKGYAAHGIDEFIVCCGYRGDVLKEFFLNYGRWQADFTVDVSSGAVEMHRHADERWKVTLVETGLQTMTGGRVRRGLRQRFDRPNGRDLPRVRRGRRSGPLPPDSYGPRDRMELQPSRPSQLW
jgi:hypothetical protein